MSEVTAYIWFEKYRPKKLKDLSLRKEYRTAFKQFIKEKQIPHLLLEGPQGSGKTTLAYILDNLIPSVSLLLNASGQDRGVETIKGKVKQFASSKPPAGKIKIVIFDEADALTKEAQNALRNTMETYSSSCRFILTCNYVDKIIAPIKSRCMRFTFDRFPKDKVVELCKGILKKERIKGVSDENLSELVDRFYPDIRSTINNLQAACIDGKFNADAISNLNADPKDVCKAILKGNLLTVRQLIAGITDFLFLYRYLFDIFIAENGDQEQKAEMALAVAEALAIDASVPDREINFVGCVIIIMQVLGVKLDFSK